MIHMLGLHIVTHLCYIKLNHHFVYCACREMVTIYQHFSLSSWGDDGDFVRCCNDYGSMH